jgi:hypothetical protein
LDVNFDELVEECGDVYDMYGLKDLMMLKRSESASKGIAAAATVETTDLAPAGCCTPFESSVPAAASTQIVE